MSSLNSPPLIVAIGVINLISLPFLVGVASDAHPWLHPWLKWACLVAFLLNAACVSLPGRLDSEVAAAMSSSKGAAAAQASEADPEAGTTSDETTALASAGDSGADVTGGIAALLPGSPSRASYVTPASWAFVIWAFIFAGEAFFVIYQLVADSWSPFSAAAFRAAPGFVSANVFQCLWCASFRQKYMDGGWTKWVGPSMLAATALTLSQAHETYSGASSSDGAVSEGVSRGAYIAALLPLTLHFGWTTAASLVNLNGSIAWEGTASDQELAHAGYVSAVLATGLGAWIAVTRSAPVYAATIAWALLGVADGMRDRAAAADNAGTKRSATWQMRICVGGAVVCIALACAIPFLST